MDVDAVLDQDAKDALVRPVAWQSPRDAVRFDDPQRQRVPRPNRLGQQAALFDDGEDVAVRHDPLDELSEGGLVALELAGVSPPWHARPRCDVQNREGF